VVDLARAIFILGALAPSIRARYWAGIVVAAACALLLAIETFLPLHFPLRSGRLEIALGAVFLGPSALPHSPPVAVSRLLMDPTHHLLAAVLAGVGAIRAMHRAAALPPESASSRKLDRAGLRLLALGVLLALLSISGVLLHLVGGDGVDHLQ
jgi:hypothetical protein